MSDNNSSRGGIGFVGLLTVAFIVLRLTNVIAWSWWWVLSPLWISDAVTVAILAVVGIVFLSIHLLDVASEKKATKRRAAFLEARDTKRVGQ